jgi:hypothetical protein
MSNGLNSTKVWISDDTFEQIYSMTIYFNTYLYLLIPLITTSSHVRNLDGLKYQDPTLAALTNVEHLEKKTTALYLPDP